MERVVMEGPIKKSVTGTDAGHSDGGEGVNSVVEGEGGLCSGRRDCRRCCRREWRRKSLFKALVEERKL